MHRGENVHPYFSSDFKSVHMIPSWNCICVHEPDSWCLSSDAFAQQCWGTWWHTLWAADSDYWLPVPSQLIPCLSVLQSVCLSVWSGGLPCFTLSLILIFGWNSPMVQWYAALCSFLFLSRLREANLFQKCIKPINLICKKKCHGFTTIGST